jgi:hypothetical protein
MYVFVQHSSSGQSLTVLQYTNFVSLSPVTVDPFFHTASPYKMWRIYIWEDSGWVLLKEEQNW